MPIYHVRLDGNLWVTAFAVVEAETEAQALARAEAIPDSQLTWDLIDEDNAAQEPDQITGRYVVPAEDDWQHPDQETR